MTERKGEHAKKWFCLGYNQALKDVEHILVNKGLPTINKECQALKKVSE